MSQISGNILSITPDGGYDIPNGYIYTFEMTIETADGNYVGQIGSKSENYPTAVGQPIIVNVTEDSHGTKFTKVNPKFAGKPVPQQRPQQQPRPQPRQNPPTASPQATGKHEPNWDAIAQGKVRHGLVCAYLNGGKEPDYAKILKHFEFIMTGKVPVMGMPTKELLEQPASFDDQSPEQEQDLGESIPF